MCRVFGQKLSSVPLIVSIVEIAQSRLIGELADVFSGGRVNAAADPCRPVGVKIEGLDDRSARVRHDIRAAEVIGVDIAGLGCACRNTAGKLLIDGRNEGFIVEYVFRGRCKLGTAARRRGDGVPLEWVDRGRGRAGLQDALPRKRRIRRSWSRRRRREPRDGWHNPIRML